jgi:hypothetical protein
VRGDDYTFFVRGATAGGGGRGVQTCFTRASLQFFSSVTILFLGEKYFR